MKAVILRNAVNENASRDELDDIVQAEAVSKALRELDIEPVTVEFTADMTAVSDSLKAHNPEFVFNLVESLNSSGQFIHFAPALLDYLQIPYTGCSTAAIFMTSNKLVAKKMLSLAGISTPEWIEGENAKTYHGTSWGNGARLSFESGHYIFKSEWEHASIGLDDESIAYVRDRKELPSLLKNRNCGRARRFYAERFIEGREFNIPVLAKKAKSGKPGIEMLPPSEMRFFNFPEHKRKILGYRAKWDQASFEYQNTERCFELDENDSSIVDLLKDIALRCWKIFGLNGYARVDFRVDCEGHPYVLEINANPCVSPDSGFVAAAEYAGLSYRELVERIVGSLVRAE